MDSEPFASRLAARIRIPVMIVGVASLILASANLGKVIIDQVVVFAGITVGAAAAAMLSLAAFDMRFQRALSALNAERRARAREIGRFARVTGWGLDAGDPLLLMTSLPLLVLTLLSANYFHRLPATALLFAAFFLTAVVQIALLVRGFPTDRWFNPFEGGA